MSDAANAPFSAIENNVMGTVNILEIARINKIPRVLNNYGIAIISTPEGVMTNIEAKEKGVGGEIICEVW